MIQTNIVGLTYLTRKILLDELERNDGYKLSIWALQQGRAYQGQCLRASKAFVKQFSPQSSADLAGKKIH